MKDAKKMKDALNEIVTASRMYFAALDAAMKEPDSNERGKKIASLTNWLNVRVDAAEHFGLGVSFDKIAKYQGMKASLAEAAFREANQHHKMMQEIREFNKPRE